MNSTPEKWSTKRKAAAVLSGVLAGSMLLSGAYAWTNYAQTVKNRFNGVSSNNVLLHDDFNGENKDVYVENLGDSPVYVRVKMTEYLQLGSYSVLDDTFSTEDNAKGDVTDKTTWATHQWGDMATQTECTGAGEECHTYYTWVLGDSTSDQKYYLSGVTESDSDGHGGLSADAWNAFVEQYKKANCTVDHTDENNLEEDATTQIKSCPTCGWKEGDSTSTEVKIGNITTTIKATVAPSDPMTLTEWLELRDKKDALITNTGTTGTVVYDVETQKKLDTPRWLLDTDGWAYWSQPLEPGEATNLLLDAVVRTGNDNPADNWAYNIDVQLQASTQEQIENWFRDNTPAVTTFSLLRAAVDTSQATTDIANPDNGVMTATETGVKFLTYFNATPTDEPVTTRELGGGIWTIDTTMSDGTTRSVYTLADIDGNVNKDGVNYLAGRTPELNGGVRVADIYPVGTYEYMKADGTMAVNTAAFYTIEGADPMYYVTAGTDKILGTFRDVISDFSGAGRLGSSSSGTSYTWMVLESKTIERLLLTYPTYIKVGQFTSASWAPGYTIAGTTSYNLKYNIDQFYVDAIGSKTAILTNQTIEINPYFGEVPYQQKCTDASHVNADGYHIMNASTACTLEDVENSKFTPNAIATGTAAGYHYYTFTATFFAPSLEEIVEAYPGDYFKYYAVMYQPDGTTKSHYWLRTPGSIGNKEYKLLISTAGGVGNYRYTFASSYRPCCYANLV